MLDTLLSLLAPHLCSSCGAAGTPLCGYCKYNINKSHKRQCLLCECLSLEGVCMLHHAFFDFAWIVGERFGGLQRLIGGLKFLYMKSAAQSVAELLDLSLPSLPRNCVLVPIPTIRRHIRQRGYDHLLLMARALSRRRGVPYAQLLRRRHSAVQHESSRRDRLRQARSAFELNGRVVPDRRYIILDDIVTTGATVSEAARVLREAGATSVWVVAVAKQTLD